jgi:hypothetical protein
MLKRGIERVLKRKRLRPGLRRRQRDGEKYQRPYGRSPLSLA